MGRALLPWTKAANVNHFSGQHKAAAEGIRFNGPMIGATFRW